METPIIQKVLYRQTCGVERGLKWSSRRLLHTITITPNTNISNNQGYHKKDLPLSSIFFDSGLTKNIKGKREKKGVKIGGPCTIYSTKLCMVNKVWVIPLNTKGPHAPFTPNCTFHITVHFSFDFASGLGDEDEYGFRPLFLATCQMPLVQEIHILSFQSWGNKIIVED